MKIRLNKYVCLFSFLLFMVYSPTLCKAQDFLNNYIEQPKKVGQARFKPFFYNLYDVSLYAPNGKFDRDKPFSLLFEYLDNENKEKLVDGLLDEISAQGFQDDDERLEAWRVIMLDIFHDIRRNDRLVAVNNIDGVILFFLNNEQIGAIEDKDLVKAYFNIWLAEETAWPEIREKLIRE